MGSSIPKHHRARPSRLPRHPTLVNRVADATAHRDRDALDHSVARLLFEFLNASSVTLYRRIEHQGEARLARRAALVRGQAQIADDTGREPATLPALRDSSVFQECCAHRQALQLADPAGHWLCVFPIEDDREVIGLLEIRADALLSPRDVQWVQGILRVLKNQLALLDYGERDTLTGLLNRKTFEARFGKLGHRPRNSRNESGSHTLPSWLGLLDIDHFKSVNDRYGHLFGDEVLLLVSQIMRRTLRGGDLLFRFGGEEFLIVLEKVDERGAHTAFGRLRAAVEAYVFPQAGALTISLGYTRIMAEDVPTTCVERADAALYHVKQSGRNNVHCYEALVAAGALVSTLEAGDVELF